MIAGNPMKQVGSASGMWRAGIWRAEDSDMPDAQVSSQQHCRASLPSRPPRFVACILVQVVEWVLEQATLRVLCKKVWEKHGPIASARDFTSVRAHAGGSACHVAVAALTSPSSLCTSTCVPTSRSTGTMALQEARTSSTRTTGSVTASKCHCLMRTGGVGAALPPCRSMQA